jgi:mRNA interferase MazF
MAVTVDRGDLVWVNFSPQKGSEQAGHRPALIISPRAYNERSRCVLACPVTSNMAPWPWKVALSADVGITGAVLVDQVRALDAEARQVRASGQRVTPPEMSEILARLATLIAEE